MLRFLLGVTIVCFWIVLIGGTTLLFSLRLYIGIKNKLNVNKLLFVILVPCSIGYYLTYPEKSTFKKIYQSLVILFFVLMLLGSVSVIYSHFG